MITSTRVKTPRLRIFAAGAAALAAASAAFTAADAQAPRLMAPPTAAEGALSFADLVERVSPAVVSILVVREVETPQLPSQLEQFFNFRFGPPDNGQNPFGDGTRRLRAEGSGFFIDDEGHIVTNNHVVAEADAVHVRLPDGAELEAEIVGTDPLADLAVLKVDPPANQAYVEFADDVNLRVGDWVLAVGNPFGLGGSVTSGIVSAIGRTNQDYQYLDFIQIDAPINRGNSGGPTFDLKGRVVGVNTAIFSPTGGSVGIGFAIPATVAKATVEQLIETGSVTRGWLGIQLQEVTTELAAALGLKEPGGVLVAEVMEGTPAEKAGLRSGDVIVGIEGDAVQNMNELSRRVAAFQPGRKVDVRFMRDGRARTVKVTLGEREDPQVAANEPPANDSLADHVGLQVTELNDALRQQFRVPQEVTGVLVTGVRRGSPAAEAGLVTGAVILQVDGEAVTSGRELRSKIENARQSGKDAVLLRMQFGPNRQYGALTLDRR